MPLYEFECRDCGKVSEVLVIRSDEQPECGSCGGHNLEKLMSAHSNSSGPGQAGLPGAGDTGCCGHTPGTASGCAGPGSCCGRG